MNLRRDYQRDGFVVLESFVEPEACDALIARAAELLCGFGPRYYRRPAA